MRNLANHIDELRVLLATNPIDALGINETWLNSTISNNELYIPGYDIISRDRVFSSADGKTYGGVCFYVRSSVNFIQRNDMSVDDLENLCIQIQKPNSKPFLVATWYRPPNSSVDKFDCFETFIDMLDAENAEYYLLSYYYPTLRVRRKCRPITVVCCFIGETLDLAATKRTLITPFSYTVRT